LFATAVLSTAVAGLRRGAGSEDWVGDTGGALGGVASDSGALSPPMTARNPVPKPCSVFKKLPCCSASAFATAGAETRPRPTNTSPRRRPERSCSASASSRSCSLTKPASTNSAPSRRRPKSATSIRLPINRPQRPRPSIREPARRSSRPRVIGVTTAQVAKSG